MKATILSLLLLSPFTRDSVLVTAKKGSSKSSKGHSKSSDEDPDYPYLFPPYGSNAVSLSDTPDWIIYGNLKNNLGLANAKDAANGIVTGALSYGTDEENPVYADEELTDLVGSFSFVSHFVGPVSVPAIISATLTIYEEDSSNVYGVIFLQGIQNADFSFGLSIVGGSGGYHGVRGSALSDFDGKTFPLAFEIYFY